MNSGYSRSQLILLTELDYTLRPLLPRSTIMESLDILYRDQYLVAINKPSGLLVHRSMIDRHETRFALQLLRDQIGQHVFPLHRLDKPTSGVLLFALSPDIARIASQQFTEQKVDKKYLAIVRGYCDEQGVIDYPLKEELDKVADRSSRHDKPAQAAVTRYRRIHTIEIPVKVDRYPTSRYSLVELHPKTGRKHQLRRHMKHIAHPIIGDAKHGKGKHNRFFQVHFNCRRLLLACTCFRLQHPITDTQLDIRAPLDNDFQSVIQRLGWPVPVTDGIQ